MNNKGFKIIVNGETRECSKFSVDFSKSEITLDKNKPEKFNCQTLSVTSTVNIEYLDKGE